MSNKNDSLDDILTVAIGQEDIGEYKRLDQFLSAKLPQFSRTFLKNLFLEGLITFSNDDDLKLELKKMPKKECEIEIHVPPPIPSEAKAEDIPLDVLYEDEHLLFVNKPAGMVTHPAPGNYTGTLVNAVLGHCDDLKGIGNKLRPGIVHRLDKGTSGVMVVAKSQQCHERLVVMFSKHEINRVYNAIAMGTNYPETGTIKSFLARHPQNRKKMAVTKAKGKHAVTHYKTLHSYQKCKLLEVTLETGRTHQIRVHLSSQLRAPILNDATYGNPKENLTRLGPEIGKILEEYPHPLLHAKILGLVHPMTGKELMFEVPLPSVFQQCLDELNKD